MFDVIKQAKIPKIKPKIIWFVETLIYFSGCFESNPSDADEKIKKPATTNIPTEIKNGMSTFTRFIIN